MIDTQKLELRVRQLEAQSEAQSEMLALAMNALMQVNARNVQQLLLDAARYSGPSNAKKAFASIAKAAQELS